MNLAAIKLAFIAIFANYVLAITHDKVIKRPATFGTIPGQSSVNLATLDTSLVRVVTPVPLSTMVEVLRVHGDKEFKEFASSHKSAIKGTRVMMGDPYEKRAKDHYNVMIQDYMPMNEAEAAAARYLFSVKTCALRADPKTPTNGLTPCQFSGAKILADIIRRLRPIQTLMNLGSLDVIADAKFNVEMQNPKEFTDQIRRIVNLLGTDEIAAHLEAAEPTLSAVWKHMRENFS